MSYDDDGYYGHSDEQSDGVFFETDGLGLIGDILGGIFGDFPTGTEGDKGGKHRQYKYEAFDRKDGHRLYGSDDPRDIGRVMRSQYKTHGTESIIKANPNHPDNKGGGGKR